MFDQFKRSSIALTAAILFVFTSGFGSAVLAQDAAAAKPAGLLEEITVTAQRREQTVMDIPSAVSVISGDDIREQLITSSHDLEIAVPGLTFHEVSGTSQVTLRGVGTGYAGPALGNSVALYMDDAYISNQVGAVEMFFDMNRVEVLKGPQPTLYGRNATGGAIQFITNKPSLDAPAGYVEVGYGEFQTIEIEGMLNQPLSDSVALRVAVRSWNRGEGHVTNVNNGEKITGENDHKRIRAQLLFQPNEKLTAIAKWEVGRDSGDEPLRRQNATGQLCRFCVDGAGDGNSLGWYETDQTPQIAVDQGVVDAWGHNPLGGNSHQRERWLDVYALNITYAFTDTIMLTSTTQYREVSQNGGQDQDASYIGWMSAFGAKIPQLPGGAYTEGPDGMVYQSLTQELRITTDSDSRFNFTAGLAFSDDDNQFTFGVGGDAWNPLEAVAPNYDDVKSVSAYLEAYIDLTDALTITVGGRYTDDEVTHAVLGGCMCGVGALLANVSQTEKFNKFTPRIALNYRADWGSAYASYSNGYKAGGYNSPSFGLQPRVEPEEIDAYEIGVKLAPMDNILIDLSYFHYDWENLQIAVIDTGSLGISQENAAAAELDGFEAAVRWAANENVSMGVSYTHLSGKYLNYSTASCFIPAWTAAGAAPDTRGLTRSNCDFDGRQLSQTPESALSADMSVAFPLGDNWNGRFNVLAAYSDAYDMIPGAGGPAQLTFQPKYTIVNLSLGIENSSGLALQLYVDNATDEEYLFESQTTDFGGYQSVQMPRVMGVRARKTW